VIILHLSEVLISNMCYIAYVVIDYNIHGTDEEDRRVNREQVVNFAEGDEFYHDLESYGWDWYKNLNPPEDPQKWYYSKMKVKQADGNGFLVEDLEYSYFQGKQNC